jgi:hypothetical protein
VFDFTSSLFLLSKLEAELEYCLSTDADDVKKPLISCIYFAISNLPGLGYQVSFIAFKHEPL